MSGHCNNSIIHAPVYQPAWQTPDADALDWRYMSTDPAGEIMLAPYFGPVSCERPANENQGPETLLDWAISTILTAVITAGLCALAVGIVAGLYIVKSALGIDLFAGHSFLHDWLYVRH